MAEQCEMTSEVLQVKEAGPLELEVFGSKTLCIEREGNTNLAPYTATLRIRNTSPTPVIVNYTLDPLRSFRSKVVFPADRPDDSIEFSDCCGDQGQPGAVEETIPPRGTLLISSWTRHHDFIWGKEVPDEAALADLIPRDYIVRFELAMTYDRGTGPTPVAEMFDIRLRAVPVVLENN